MPVASSSSRFQDAMVSVVGQRQAEVALQLGEMYPSTEALRIKLVDKLVAEDQVREAALTEMDKWLTIPGMMVSLRLTTEHNFNTN